jgi:putative flippase GtrA
MPERRPIESPRNSKRELLRFVKFGIVGALNTLVDYSVWAGLFYFSRAPLLLAQTAGYSAGIVNSYILNSLWTFGEKQLGSKGRILRFLLVNAASYAASLGLIVAFSIFVPPWLAKVCTVGATLAMNFIGV